MRNRRFPNESAMGHALRATRARPWRHTWAVLGLLALPLWVGTARADRRTFSAVRPVDRKQFEGEDLQGYVLRSYAATLVLGPSGPTRSTLRWVYQVTKRKGVSALSPWKVAWFPWLETRPSALLRVVSRRRLLSQATQAKGILGGFAGDALYLIGARMLQIPVAKLARDTTLDVIEWHRYRNHGQSGGSWFWRIPDERIWDGTQLAVYGNKTGFRYHVFDLPEARRQLVTRGGQQILTLKTGRLGEPKEPEPYAPGGSWGRGVLVSTYRSWAQVSSDYYRYIARHIRPQQTASLAKWIEKRAGGRRPRAVVAAFLEYVARHVRYTSVLSGPRLIEPADPWQTLRNGYGDCKDLSVLLVSLLLKLGIPAQPVLVRTGQGDQVPQVPNLAGFNHVIVLVGGPKPFYVDPTAPEWPVGTLPDAIQGRWGLLVQRSGGKLVRLWRSRPKDNAVVFHLDVTFPRRGPADATVTITGWGRAGAWLGGMVLHDTQLDEDELAELARIFRGERVRVLSLPNLRQNPRILKLRVEQVQWAGLGDLAATANIPSYSLDWEIPAYLKAPVVEEDERLRRRKPLQLPNPTVRSVRCTIHFPVGYVLEKVPKSSKKHIFPVGRSLKVTYVDNVLRTDERFWIWKGDLLPKEVAALVHGLQELNKDSKPIRVAAWSEGARLVLQGHWRRAFARFSAGARAGQAKLLGRYLSGLFALGFGHRALRAAETLARSPTASPRVAYEAARALSQNEWGAPFAPGFRRTGALQALNRALQKGSPLIRRPEVWARAAAVLAHDPVTGGLVRNRRDLERAAQYYVYAWKGLKATEWVSDLLKLWLLLGQNQAAIRLAKKEGRHLPPDLSLAAFVVEKGAGRTARSLAAVGPALLGRQLSEQLLRQVAWRLVTVRRYGLAARLVQAADEWALGNLRTRMDFAKMRRWESWKPKGNTLLDRARSALKELIRLSARGQWQAFWHPAATPASRRQGRRYMQPVRFTDTPVRDLPHPDLFWDLLLTQKAQAEGDGAGGIRFQLLLGEEVGWTCYLQPHGGAVKLRAVGSEPGELGLAALEHLEAGRLDAARKWLDWAWDHVRHSGDPVELVPFASLWFKGQKGHAEAMRLAAAALAAEVAPAKALAILRRLRLRSLPPYQRLHLARAAARAALAAGDFKAARRYASQALALRPEAQSTTLLWGRVLVRAGASGRLLGFLGRATRKPPLEPNRAAVLAWLYALAGRADQGRALVRAQLEAHVLSRALLAVGLALEAIPARGPSTVEGLLKALRADKGLAQGGQIERLAIAGHILSGKPQEAAKRVWSLWQEDTRHDHLAEDLLLAGLFAEAAGQRAEAWERYKEAWKHHLQARFPDIGYVAWLRMRSLSGGNRTFSKEPPSP